MKNENHHQDEGEDDVTPEERAERARWLVSGGKDSRVAIWPLKSFEKT
jgi:hypothetical protein